MSIFEGMSDAHIAYAVRMAEKHYLSIGLDPFVCDVSLRVLRDCDFPAALASQAQAEEPVGFIHNGTFAYLGDGPLTEGMEFYASSHAHVPDGFVLVPREPTDDMLDKANGEKVGGHCYYCSQEYASYGDATRVWAAMIAAAPAPEER